MFAFGTEDKRTGTISLLSESQFTCPGVWTTAMQGRPFTDTHTHGYSHLCTGCVTVPQIWTESAWSLHTALIKKRQGIEVEKCTNTPVQAIMQRWHISLPCVVRPLFVGLMGWYYWFKERRQTHQHAQPTGVCECVWEYIFSSCRGRHAALGYCSTLGLVSTAGP